MRDSEWVTVFAMIPKELAVETGPHLAIKPPDMGHPSSGVKTKGAAGWPRLRSESVLSPVYQVERIIRPLWACGNPRVLWWLEAELLLAGVDRAQSAGIRVFPLKPTTGLSGAPGD